MSATNGRPLVTLGWWHLLSLPARVTDCLELRREGLRRKGKAGSWAENRGQLSPAYMPSPRGILTLPKARDGQGSGHLQAEGSWAGGSFQALHFLTGNMTDQRLGPSGNGPVWNGWLGEWGGHA